MSDAAPRAPDSRPKGIRRRVISAARHVYLTLGWGWREEVYREALARDLIDEGLQVAVEVAMPISYKGRPLSHVSVRWDMLVENCVLVELKAVQGLRAGALRQCERYAAFSDHECVAINFPDKPSAVLQFAY